MAHVGKECRLRLASLFGGIKRFLEGLAALLQFAAVFFRFVFEHKTMQEAYADHAAHRIEWPQGEEHLEGYHHHHGKAKEPDGQMPLPDIALRLRGCVQSIN